MKIDELKVGDRVLMLSGRTAVILRMSEDMNRPIADRVEIRYEGGISTWAYTSRVLEILPPVVEQPPVPEEPKKVEGIRAGDRVRHNYKVHTDYRRLGGKVLSVGGIFALVQWDGAYHQREELTVQLEVLHRAAETEEPTVGQAIEILRAEYKTTEDQLEELQAYKQSLGVAIDVLVKVVI